MVNQNRFGKVVFSIVLIVLFYTVLTIYSDVDKINQNFIQIKIIYLLPIIITYVFVMFVSSLRQKFLLNKLGFKINTKDSFFLSVAGLSMMITPVGFGQLIKTYYMKKKYGYPINRTFPLLIIEKFSDLFIITTFVLFSLWMHFSMISTIILLTSYAVLVAFVAVLFNKKVFNVIKKILKKMPFISRSLDGIEEVDINIKKIFRAEIIVVSLLITSIGVALESLVIYFGFKAFNVDLQYLEIIQIYYTSIIGGALSLIPGGVGFTEGSFVNLLTHRNFTLDLATSLILFIRMTTVWFATMIGFIFSFFILRKISKQIEITKMLDSPTMWELGRILLDLIFGLYRKRFKKIRNWKIQDDVTVMDVGCGTGQYSKITSGKYLGIDLNSNYINYCVNKYANNHNKSFRCADVITLLNEKARFDVVLMVDFLHHIPDDIAKKILRTSSELATKYIICFEPILEQSNVIGRLIINNDRGDHIRSLDELHELFHDTGCKIIESSEIWLGPIRSRAILAIPSVSI